MCGSSRLGPYEMLRGFSYTLIMVHYGGDSHLHELYNKVYIEAMNSLLHKMFLASEGLPFE